MVGGNFEHTATLLQNGQVLVAGGSPVAELYNPATGTWTTTGSLSVTQRGPTATLLPNGQVLLVGGIDNNDGDRQYGHWTLPTYGDAAAKWAGACSRWLRPWHRRAPRGTVRSGDWGLDDDRPS